MPSATSSRREEMYTGIAPGSAQGFARCSQTGDHSEPGEAKIRSTPIEASSPRKASSPVSVFVSIGDYCR
ncbi:MAG: hypothetical protein IT514_10020 [Burkholderiales bacterium]|nr:hypothetical protein [Burkholderiales bacterium]